MGLGWGGEDIKVVIVVICPGSRSVPQSAEREREADRIGD